MVVASTTINIIIAFIPRYKIEARVPEQIVVVVRADEVLDAFQCVSLGVTTGPGPS